MTTYHLRLHLLNQSAKPLVDFNIEVWIGGQQLSSVLTDAEGQCTAVLSFPGQVSSRDVRYAHFIIYKNGKWVYGDVNSPQYPLEGSELQLELTIHTRRVDFIPFSLSKLRRSSGQLEGLSESQQNYVAGKFNTALQTAVQRVLREAGRQEEITWSVDYTAWESATLGEVMEREVVPLIATTRVHETGDVTGVSIDDHLQTRLTQNPRAVREILHLEVPLIQNPIFWEEVQVLRTTELTDIILPGYTDLPDQMLEQAWDWERAGAEQWDALPLTEADKSTLQRGFSLSRLTGGLPVMVGLLMPEITDLSQLTSYDTAHLLEKIQASGGETPNGETPEEYAGNLVSLAQRNFPSAFFLERKVRRSLQGNTPDDEAGQQALANTYRYLGVKELVNTPGLSWADMDQAIAERQGYLRQFIQNNPGLDLRTANLFQKQENGERTYRFGGIPEDMQKSVHQQMLAYQRVMNLAGSYEAQDALLAAGIDSSAELMRRRPEELQAQLGGVLDAATINSLLQHGQQQLQQLTNTAVALQGLGVANGIGFAVDNYPDGLKNELENIYGYSDLFGSQDYCACEHCKSIFGPAAYFVDLMTFVEDQVKLAPLSPPWTVDTHPIALRKRRPDLWNLELTCENTNAAIPYLQIINEIKQHYIAEVMSTILGGKPANEVDIWAEFARLPPAGSSTDLTGLAINIGNTWKNSFRLAYNRPFEESRILLEHFGMRYADIIQALRVAEPYRMEQAYLDLSAEEWRVLTTPDTNMGDLRHLRFGFPLDSEHDLKEEPSYFKLARCPVPVFLRATGLSRADAEFLLSDRSYLHGLSAALALKRVPVPGEVQEYEEWIEGLNNAAVLDQMHRLLRLRRHLPWTLRELDLAVQTLGGLADKEIAEIARIREMQRVLSLTFEEAIALQHGIPDTPLYTRTVYNALLNSSVEVSVPGMLSRLFDPKKLPLNSSGLMLRDPEKLPFLLQGLGSTEEDFDSLHRMIFGTSDVNLDWGSLSLFYRLIRLAKAFGITGEDLYYLLQLSHPNPGDSVAGWILDLERTMEQVRKMPLSIQEIWFIVRGEKTSKIDFNYKGDPARVEATKGKALEWIGAFVKDQRLRGADAMLPADVFQEHLAQSLTANKDIFAGMPAWYANYQKVWDEAQDNFAGDNQNFRFDELVNMLPVFERVKLLTDKLELDAEDLLLPNSTQGGEGDVLSRLQNISDLQGLTTYARLKKQGSETLDSDTFRSLWSADQIDSQSEAFATLLNCESNQVTAVFKLVSDPLSRPVSDVLLQIEDLIGVFSRLGIYEKNILYAFAHNDYGNALQYEAALRAAFRSRYATEEAYEKAWEPYENRLQESRRDVLCAFLLALDQQNHFHDTGDLYAYFLVDVEMSGCARVSRILAATLSLQLYVHRVLMGLEVSTDNTGKVRAVMDELAKLQWEWRKNYRVWEANRKVFLYPENWIEPELRDDKSLQFKTLEDELLQQKISLESAEAAYVQYLKGYLEVANLKIGGSYYDKPTKCYHLFGRTKEDPNQYFYRKFYPDTQYWTAWEKVELAIGSPHVGPVIYKNQVYLFWVDIVSNEVSYFNNGNSDFYIHTYKVDLNYSVLTPNGKWLQPQKIRMAEEPINKYWAFNDFGSPGIKNKEIKKEFNKDYYYSTKSFRKIYPAIINGKLHIQYQRESIQYDWKKSESEQPFYLYRAWVAYSLNTVTNSLNEEWIWQTVNNEKVWVVLPEGLDDGRLYFQESPPNVLPSNDGEIDAIADSEAVNWRLAGQIKALAEDDPRKLILRKMLSERQGYFAARVDKLTPEVKFASIEKLTRDKNPVLQIVHSSKSDTNETGGDYIFEYDNQVYFIHRSNASDVGISKTMSRISTSITDKLIDSFMPGLDEFLSTKTQEISEIPFSLSFPDTSILKRMLESTDHLDFTGAHGLYFRELFFHIPFLIGDHLNAEGKYPEADFWYRKIFDPSAAFDSSPDPRDRYWQFLEFRNQTLPKLKELLTDPAAIAAYEDDPFNPHAIARLRMGAYQKSIVMKYVDNLLDWGDSLFRRDTWESNTEAMMLYQLAQDILGPHPQNTGPCESAIDTDNCGCSDPKTTYAKLKKEDHSSFLYYLENWVFRPDPTGPIGTGTAHGNGGLIGYGDLSVSGQDTVNTAAAGSRALGQGIRLPVPSYAADLGPQLIRRQVFCIPNNEKMFDYWDRVADRMFKLRNCMNIDGVKRSLALFQPPIDPALLVAARAAGLSLDDVLNGLYGELPAYRFTYLLEKAKAFAGTVQGFSGALLSALEKKDAEQLTLLRSTHEQNILKLTREIKKKAVEEAKANLQGTLEGMANVVNRVTQYTQWIEENLNGWERTQQIALHTSSTLSAIQPIYDVISTITAMLPNVGAPTAMTFGGTQLSKGAEMNSHLISSLAHLASLVSTSAGLEANFQRRNADWEFQLKLAEQEVKQVQQQIVSGQIRLAIAEKDLEIHEKQIEQAEEVHDFYKNKFTGLGLYNYMATTLSRLNRMAFNTAMDLARQAEAAYRFETRKEDYFDVSSGPYWDASRAGLLSGEQLSLALQKMDAGYLQWNTRQMEIRQSFSMRMLAPEQLLNLRINKTCTFKIPEWAFDMQYPGHYRRRIASVQITIPCVTGPYTNVAVTLTLKNSSLRKNSNPDEYKNKPNADFFSFQGCKMVATSSANNDGGQFELNFRDERYLPFEGAGAVDSEWQLELPADFPSFDYSTISDVIVHLNYRALTGGEKPDSGTMKHAMGNLKRLISLKEEFPDALFQLGTGGNAVIRLTKKHFPYFAQTDNFAVVMAHIFNPSKDLNAAAVPDGWEFTLVKEDKKGDDIWLLVKYAI